MTPDVQRILLTVPFIIVLIVMFFWLVKALLPGKTSSRAEALKLDDFDRSGYETMEQIRRKEYGVMALGTVVIVICVLLVGGLGYWVIKAAASGDSSADGSFELLITFIPAIIMLFLIVSGSRRYVKIQQQTLGEYRMFQTKRKQALKEYEEKRKGAKEDAKKKDAGPQSRRMRKPPEKPDRQKKRRPKLRKTSAVDGFTLPYTIICCRSLQC
ncbi:hypothetical protein ACFL5K_01190 [Gemmatimonadota bacterium]